MHTVHVSPPNTPTQNIYRLGSNFVHWYLIETVDGLTVIDTGFSKHWQRLLTGLRTLNRPLSDIKAILLTHSHFDHVGFAERARTTCDAPVYIHPADSEAATSTNRITIPPAFLRNLWRPATIRNLIRTTLDGALQITPIQHTTPIADGDTLPVPGQPRVIHLPGHTPGSCAFYLENKGARVLISGDALCTASPITSAPEPPMTLKNLDVDPVCAMQSLGKLENLGDVLMLPGHGNPWQGDIRDAIASARNA